MGQIVLLDELTTCKIAAGEVIERPASVVKEMAENAIDAGATSLSVEIRAGGIKSIRISDNGSGIADDDAELAFDKHATSKIRSAEDLEGVSTLGFRGEALASIAAVSRVELTTRTRDAELATFVRIEGGKILEKGLRGGSHGTTFLVRDLFYNTPARYKFLKKDSTEAGYICDVLQKLALAHPEVAIKLVSGGTEILRTPGNGDLKSTIYSIYGKKVTDELRAVAYAENGIDVSGFIGVGDAASGNRSRQIFFVNGRCIKSKTLTAALDEGCRTLVMKGRFAFAVLQISVSPYAVDVNVHPAKTEVRFSDEGAVFRAVMRAVPYGDASHYRGDRADVLSGDRVGSVGGVRSVLSGQQEKETGVPASDDADPGEGAAYSADSPDAGQQAKGAGTLESEVADPRGDAVYSADSPTAEQQAKGAETLESEVADPRGDAVYSADSPTAVFNGTARPEIRTPFSAGKQPWKFNTDRPQINRIRVDDSADSARPSSSRGTELPHSEGTDLPLAGGTELPHLEGTDLPKVCDGGRESAQIVNPFYLNARLVGQILGTYLVLEYNDAMYLLDQHAAHERLLYEKLLQACRTGRPLPTQMMLAPVTITLSPNEMHAYEALSGKIAALGFETETFGRDAIIVRAIPAVMEGQDIVAAVQALLTENEVVNPEIFFDEERLHTVACKAAVKGNHSLKEGEIRQLLQNLACTDQPGTCPHGRPIVVEFGKNEIERKFKRAL